MRHSAFTLVEGLMGACVLAALLIVMWPLFRTIMRAEAQLAALTGPALAASVLRERLRWDIELASPSPIERPLVVANGAGLDLAAAGGGFTAWRFDAKLHRFTRNGEPIGPALTSAHFALVTPHTLEVLLVHAPPTERGDRLVLRLKPLLTSPPS